MWLAGILKNALNGKFHPVVLRPAPTPGPIDNPMRWRSFAHHTIGFDSEEAALQEIAKHPDWELIPATWDWDGNDIPTITYLEGIPKEGK